MADLIQIPIYGDARDPVDYLPLRSVYLEQLRVQVGLDVLWLESVSLYACVDGPVLVLQGERGGRHSIRCITPEIAKLLPTSAIYTKWRNHRGTQLTIKGVHQLILQITGQEAN